jgi:YidC/Oxa1 family membrane protein insertase
MEQKTFLAIVLSFIFLLSYNALVIAPHKKHNNNLQAIENKPVVDSSISVEETSIPSLDEASLNNDKDAPQAELETETFRFDALTTNGHIKALTAKAYNYSPSLGGFVEFSPLSKLNSYSQDQEKILLLYNGDLQITRTLKSISNNTITAEIEYKNTSSLSNLKNVQIALFTIDIHRIKNDPSKMRDNMLFEYSIFANNKLIRKGNAFKFSDKENKTEQGAIEWAGWRDRYHFTVVKPEFKTTGYSIKAIDDHQLQIAVNAGEINLKPGAKQTFNFTIYVGPQDLQLLRKLDGNIHKIMAFSGYGFLDFIEKFIYNILLLMNKVIPNWGLCIILISLLIYGTTYPLTLKSMLSMRKMQELQPKMAELREKYKNNPQKLNTEVVQLYRTHNINPLGGCLPVLLQMPVFISLYQVLWRTQNFQGAKFLWIKDLSAPDRLFMLPSEFPFIGNEFNLLPVLMMIVMFFQQKISAKNMVVVDPAQEMQQKMMMFVMPVFIGGIFYHFASGLTLYFTIFYLLSTLTQYKMSKLNKAK